MLGGTFQGQWPSDLCGRIQAYTDARAAAFYERYQKDSWRRVAAGNAAIVYESEAIDETGASKFRCLTQEPYAASAEDAATIQYISPEKLKHYKKTLERYDLITKVSSHCDLLRATTKPQLLGIISTREFVDVACSYRCRDGTMVQYATQAPQEALEMIPIQPHTIRGKDFNTLTIFRQTDENPRECHSEQVFQNDPCGSLPGWAVKKGVAQSLLDGVKMIRDMTTQFPDVQTFRSKADLIFHWDPDRK